MDGPWTQFAPQAAAPAAASDGPWAQFAPAAPVAPNPDAGLNEFGITGDPQQFNDQKPGLSIPVPKTADEARAMLAEKPGYTASSILPMRVKNDAGGQADPSLGVEWDLGPLRGIGNAAIDLAEGPTTGTVTPAGSQLLFGAMTGGALAPSLARGTGAAIADAAAYGAPKSELYGARPEIARPVDAPEALEAPPPAAATAASQIPASPAFVPPGSTFPETRKVYPTPRFIPPVPENVPSRTPPAPRFVQSAGEIQAQNPLSSLADGTGAAPPNALLPGAAPLAPGWTVDDRFGQTQPSAQSAPVTSGQVQRRDGVGYNEALRRAQAENAAAPAPQSVGAAASRDMTAPSSIAMAPQDAAASQATGENWRLAQPAVQGIDKTEYVKGVVPTAAEVAGNADISAQQKYVMQTPGQVEKFRAQQASNNDRRIDHYDELAGTPTIVDTMKDARSAQADADLKAAWGNKKPVDAQPVVDQIDAVLSGPQGKLSAVRSSLKAVRDTLHDADGKLETDPEVLYGARREVAAMLGKAAQQEKPTLRDAASQLGNVKDSLDQTIEQGANGYRQYLKNYSDASRPIDARELLLDARPGLTNGADRQLSFAKVDRLMRDIVAKRQAAGSNPAKSLTDDQMEGLWNLHSDLKRLGNLDLGRPKGSDTSALGRMGGALGLGSAHVAANWLLPVAGSFLVHEGKSLVSGKMLNRRVNKLMDGPNYKP